MKKITRRNFLKVASATTIAAGLAACGSEPASSTAASSAAAGGDAAPAKKEARTLYASVMQTRSTPGLDLMIQKLKDEENITVDLQVVPDEQYDNLIKMKVGSGEPCDLIDYNQPQICGFFAPPEDFLYDLSNEPWVENLSARDNIEFNGKIYGYPFNAIGGFQGMIYNKAVFAEAGIEKEPTNKAEFDAACEKIVAIGKPAILLPKDTWVPQIWMTAGYAQAMGSVQACADFSAAWLKHEDSIADHPELAAVVDDFASNFVKGFVNDDWLTVDHNECIRRLAEGEAGMYYQNAVVIVSQIMKSHPETELGVFMYPSDFNKDSLLSVTASSPGFSVNKNSENVDLALEVLRLFSTPDYADLYYVEGWSNFPGLTTSNGGELSPVTMAVYDQYVAQGKYVKEMNNHWVLVQPLMNSTLWIYYQEAGKGTMDGTELLGKYQKDVETYMKEQKAEGFV